MASPQAGGIGGGGGCGSSRGLVVVVVVMMVAGRRRGRPRRVRGRRWRLQTEGATHDDGRYDDRGGGGGGLRWRLVVGAWSINQSIVDTYV